MRTLFLVCFAVLSIAGIATYYSLPENQTDYPVLYWVTDANPARKLQVETFHKWLEKNGHPKFELKVDSASGNPKDKAKKIVQAISGVGSDIMDLFDAQAVYYFDDMGLLVDVTEPAKQLGFSPDNTFSAVEPSITHFNRQYAFPCNVSVQVCVVNKGSFRKLGMEPPPNQWDFETFEKIGKEFVQKANADGQLPRHFFVDTLDWRPLFRSLGGSIFNETLTQCTVDQPQAVEVFKKIYKWTYTDRILPSLSDQQSFATDSGYGGAETQLLNSGHYAMVQKGRYIIIQLREFDPPLDLSVAQMPHGGFPNVRITTRCAAVYKGSKYPELAKLFLSFLASKEYNDLIVEDGDALPPNPLYSDTEAFRAPAKYPNEIDYHKHFKEIAETVAISTSTTPFANNAISYRIQDECYKGFMADLYSAEKAISLMQKRINEEIERTVKGNREIREKYQQAFQLQQKIDALKAKGEPIPQEWITNPFHLAYYKKTGQLKN